MKTVLQVISGSPTRPDPIRVYMPHGDDDVQIVVDIASLEQVLKFLEETEVESYMPATPEVLREGLVRLMDDILAIEG